MQSLQVTILVCLSLYLEFAMQK
uniref:Uncharacterized protein n=1 Tax=Rhizophora mucronata TaxID=61149 RepID=A0A2P2NVX4_RHIMU